MKIDKGVPMPYKRGDGRPAGEQRRLMMEMEIGDSIEVTRDQRQQVSVIGKTLGRTFVTRKVDEGVYRVWRTA